MANGSNQRSTLSIASCFLLGILFSGLSIADTAIKKLDTLNSSSFILLNSEDQVLDSLRAETPYIPASTTKLITAWLALQHWGEDYRFKTSVYIDTAEKTLWFKGSGDPFLVSEELQQLVQRLLPQLNTDIKTIALDVSLFEPLLIVPGASTTNNPYDAIPTAIACNFNTLNLKQMNGVLESAEPQTPLTPYARTFAHKINGNSLRINTGQDPRLSERYFAEVVREMLRSQGVKMGDDIRWGVAPTRDPDFVYENSHTLGTVIQLMLKYSTNFISNELILALVAEHYGKPASFSLVRDYMNSTLSKRFDWETFNFDEGAGLSTGNQLSSRQLSALLLAFKPWSHLMPEVEPGIFAKTGTLENVQTLAGYIRTGKEDYPFAIMINETIEEPLASDIAIELKRRLDSE